MSGVSALVGDDPKEFPFFVWHNVVVIDHSAFTAIALCVIPRYAILLLALYSCHSLGRLLRAGTWLITQPWSTTCGWQDFKSKILGPTDYLFYYFWKKHPYFSVWL